MLFVWATAGSAYANVVVDMSQVQDYTKYQTDLQQCEGLAVQNQPSAPQRDSVAGTAVKGAAVGAAAGAVSGGSGSKAAKKGAGAGVILAAGRNSSERRNASANATAQKDQIVKNCMLGRGYNVLN
ncbi:MAG: glycine zipper family protein [Luminiphilus sp.]|nr:glycine zipper family protein [Luminiphilus sp.]